MIELISKGIELIGYCIHNGDLNAQAFMQFEMKLEDKDETITSPWILAGTLLSESPQIRYFTLNALYPVFKPTK